MKPLDIAADLITRILSPLPDSVGQFMWFPLLVTVVIVVARFVVRRLANAMGDAMGWVVRTASVMLGMAMLMPEALAASAMRIVRLRPAAVLYGYGDAVATAVGSLHTLSRKVTTFMHKVSKVNFAVVLVLIGAWLWAWDHGRCASAPPQPCVSPVAQWYHQILD